jgi:DNA-binding MarR family transcriptional regulator
VSHPAIDLDDVVHQRVRLAILAVLAEARRADFTFLRDTLGTTDGNLSRHLQVLADAGLVEIHKGFEGKRPRTWVSSTGRGRKALASEVSTLKDIVGRLEAQRGSGTATD